ncbi:hypothetical protein GCM10027443_16480 [Pontibacter brevis]
MKKFYNTRLLLLLCLVLSFGILASCDNNEEVDPAGGQVQLLSFGPSGVQHGEEIRFIGHNLNKVEAIEFAGVTVPKASFIEHTPKLIRVMVPQEAEEGRVTLKTNTGEDVVSKTVLSFQVPVTVNSVTEEARPGENITITGNYLNWVREVVFEGATVTEFVSQSMSELVLQVPMEARTGKMTIMTGGTEPLAIEMEQNFIVTLPSITGLAPNPVERESNLTITGANLDLVRSIKFAGVTDPVTEFVSQNATQLVVVVPAEAGNGVVTLVAPSGVEVESSEILRMAGNLPPLAPLPYVLYDDARGTGWDNWGWGGPTVWNSTERVRQGEYAAKKTYDGSYDAIRWHNNTALSTSGYSELTFSVYGGPGTNGKNMQLVINEVWGSPYVFPIVEGEWTTYNIPLSELGNPATIGDVLFQSAGWAGVVHYDHVGFK